MSGAPFRDEAGFAAPLLLVLLVVVGVLTTAVADAANVLVAAQRARAAADAAALAAATSQWPFLDSVADPPGAADEYARANGARLESCTCPLRGPRATVEVSVPTAVRVLRSAPARVHARATAAVSPGVLFSPPDDEP